MRKRHLAAAIAAVVAMTSSVSGRDASDYRWERVVAPGGGCLPERCNSAKWPMTLPVVASPGDQLWVFADAAAWSSSDGRRWRQRPKTPWGERAGAAYSFFRGRFWMMGGMRSWDAFRNDVWSSPDGARWTRSTTAAPWSPRRGHSLVVFRDRLWLLGGAASSGRADELPREFLNDVWSSSDGVRWTRESGAAAWPARDAQRVVVFDDRLWVIGGSGRRDVWSSADGRAWTLVTHSAAWEARASSGLAVFDERLWVFGGIGRNDVWWSRDGRDWHQAAASAPWSTRTAEVHTVHRDRLWLFSGKTGRADSWDGAIWTMSPTP